jgi:hypothetical protein
VNGNAVSNKQAFIKRVKAFQPGDKAVFQVLKQAIQADIS